MHINYKIKILKAQVLKSYELSIFKKVIVVGHFYFPSQNRVKNSGLELLGSV